MAKARKSSSAAVKSSHPAQKSASSGVPTIDPSSVAASAAKMVGAKVAPLSTSVGVSHVESAGFRNLKQNLHKPTGGALGGLLDKTTPAGVKRQVTGQNFKQVGHNQTIGHEANRTYVPRRTGGG